MNRPRDLPLVASLEEHEQDRLSVDRRELHGPRLWVSLVFDEIGRASEQAVWPLRGSTDKTTRSIADALEQPSDLRFEIFALQIAGEANCVLANRIGAEPRQLLGFALANLLSIRGLSLGWGLERPALLITRDFYAQTFHEAFDLGPQIFAHERARKLRDLIRRRIQPQGRQLGRIRLAGLLRRHRIGWDDARGLSGVFERAAGARRPGVVWRLRRSYGRLCRLDRRRLRLDRRQPGEVNACEIGVIAGIVSGEKDLPRLTRTLALRLFVIRRRDVVGVLTVERRGCFVWRLRRSYGRLCRRDRRQFRLDRRQPGEVNACKIGVIAGTVSAEKDLPRLTRILAFRLFVIRRRDVVGIPTVERPGCFVWSLRRSYGRLCRRDRRQFRLDRRQLRLDRRQPGEVNACKIGVIAGTVSGEKDLPRLTRTE